MNENIVDTVILSMATQMALEAEYLKQPIDGTESFLSIANESIDRIRHACKAPRQLTDEEKRVMTQYVAGLRLSDDSARQFFATILLQENGIDEVWVSQLPTTKGRGRPAERS